MSELKRLSYGSLSEFENVLKEFEGLAETPDNFDSQRTYEIIKHCEVMLAYYDKSREATALILKLKSHEKLVHVIEHLCSVRNEIDFKASRQVLEYDHGTMSCYQTTNMHERRIFNIVSLDYIFNLVMGFSFEFRRFFTRLNSQNTTYLKCFIEFIDDTTFISNFNNFNSKFKAFTITIVAISKIADECRNIWQELNSVEILLKLNKLDSKWKMTIYGIISNIASDEEIEKIPEIDQIINTYITFVYNCINNPEGNRSYQYKDDDDVDKNFNVNYVSDVNKISMPVTSLLSHIYHLSVNEKIKFDIFKKQNFFACLKKLVFTGKEVEKQHAIQCLAQLAFSEQVNKELNAEHELIDHIKTVGKQDKFEFKKLKKTCEEFVWILKNEKELSSEDVKPAVKEEHIMISYNTGSRELCLRIKAELEKLNMKVWIDVSEIHGSSLDSMANAVENARCVLMCVTEKYRQSLNCQAEAQYAFRLNKIIIPLIMQPGYHKVSGWLGFIIGDKIFIDFTRYAFDDSLKRLIKQIELNTKEAVFARPLDMTKSVQVEVKCEGKDAVKTWSEDQVKSWFQTNEFDVLYEGIGPMDGTVFYQFYQIKLDAPEFFFKSLTESGKANIKIISNFSKKLTDLFQN